MKSLDSIAEPERTKILQISSFIREEIRPEKIILFGSFANGNNLSSGYDGEKMECIIQTDYDFLIVTLDDKEKECIIVEKITSLIMNHFQIALCPVVHSIKFVNQGLLEGQFFFKDILETGILLFDTEEHNFAKPKKLTLKEQERIAKDYFDYWYAKAESGLRLATLSFNDHNICDAAFMLHQATERLYICTLLVLNGYKPRTHNLSKLRRYSKHCSIELFEIFPCGTEDAYRHHLYELLKSSYINSRYKKDFKMTTNEFLDLKKSIRDMFFIVQRICSQKIESYSFLNNKH